MLRLVVLLLALLTVAAPAGGDPVKLRMAAIAPDGTAWARELRAFGRDVESHTNGAVVLKWYLGGIAGDELTSLERVRKGQLDGLAGAIFCERLAPSLWVTRLVGLFNNSAEAKGVLRLLQPKLAHEFEQSGFVDLGVGSFGTEIFFTRTVVRSMADLRKGRFFTWNLDDFWLKELPAMGIHSVPLPVEDAGKAYDDGLVDGFIGVPTAALAYQWSTRAHFFTSLHTAFLPGCLVVARRAFDGLPLAHQQAIRSAAAKFVARFEDLGAAQDEALLGGLFQHQGLVRADPSPELARDFNDAARDVRNRIGAQLVPQALLSQVLSWLADARVDSNR